MKKKILYAFLFIGLIGAGVAYWGYNSIFSPNTAFEDNSLEIRIPEGSSFTDLVSILKSGSILNDISSFELVSGWMNYDKSKIPSGLYNIIKGWNNREIIGVLRSGNQKPVKVTYNNVRSLNQLAGAITKELALDSVTLCKFLNAPAVQSEMGFNEETFMTAFIPNTYNMFWNISKEKVVARLVKEQSKFWDKKGRKEKAKTLNLTEKEVYTLASIVEKESQDGPERPIIAGLYLNRLKRGIPLQADPTVVFATGKFDLRRVLNEHLKVDSPYNTYRYTGLPPGPIYMPSIQSIDAVLDHKKHDYIYMCAKPGYGTKHAFAKTLRGHNKNANEYRKWLNKQGIR